MPKKVRATISTIQIPHGTFQRGISNKNEATIPIPQTLKIMLRFFFSGVGSPVPFVKRNKELKDNNPKKINAEML